MVHLSLLVAQKVQTFGSYPLAIGLFVSVSLLVSLCAKHSRKSIKLSTRSSPFTANNHHRHHDNGDLMIPPRSPLQSAKQLISSISDKALPFIHHRKNRGDEEDEDEDLEKAMAAEEENEGVWQKAILMGEKCQPPDFSGVIYYDYDGNRIAEMPKSPRANFIVSGGGSPSPTAFSFPVVRDDNYS